MRDYVNWPPSWVDASEGYAEVDQAFRDANDIFMAVRFNAVDHHWEVVGAHGDGAPLALAVAATRDAAKQKALDLLTGDYEPV